MDCEDMFEEEVDEDLHNEVLELTNKVATLNARVADQQQEIETLSRDRYDTCLLKEKLEGEVNDLRIKLDMERARRMGAESRSESFETALSRSEHELEKYERHLERG